MAATMFMRVEEVAEEKCGNMLYNCVQLIANLSVLLHPFLPFSSQKLFDWLGINPEWISKYIPSGHVLPDIIVLFKRLD
jgi:methionyl-tRNA synthetase